MPRNLNRSLIAFSIAQALGTTALALSPFNEVHASNTPPVTPDQQFLDRQDFQRTLINLKNAVTQDPQNAQLRARLGAMYLRAGDPVAAEKEFNRARALGDINDDLRLKLAEAWLLQRKYTELFSDLELSAIQSVEALAELQVLRGKANLARKRFTIAQEDFDAALEQIPGLPSAQLGLARLNLATNELGAAELTLARVNPESTTDLAEKEELVGDLAMARQRFANAEAAYRRALALRPEAFDLLSDLAVAQLNQQHYPEAETTIEQLKRIAPKSGFAILLQAMAAFEQQQYSKSAELAGQLASVPNANASALYVAGVSAYMEKSSEQARSYLSRFVSQRPDDPEGRKFLGAALLQLGEYGEANAVLAPLAENPDDDLGTLSVLASAAALTGDAKKSVELLARAVELAPDDLGLAARLSAARLAAGDRVVGLEELKALAESADDFGLFRQLAANHLTHGEYDDALSLLETEAPDEAAGPGTLVMRAKALMGKNDLDAAGEIIAQALSQYPDDLDVRSAEVELLLRHGDTEGAIGKMARIAADNPRRVEPQISLARLEVASTSSDDGLERLKTLVREYPTRIDARLALVDAHLARQQWEEARAVLDATENSESPAVLLKRAELLIESERLAPATELLEGVVERSPGLVEARLLLATAYQRAGNTPAGLEQIEAAAALAPESPIVRIHRARALLTQAAPDQDAVAQAQRDIALLQREHKMDPNVVQLAGLYAARTGHGEEGARLLTAAHEAIGAADSALLLSDTLWGLGERERAIDETNRWLAFHPNETRALLKRAGYNLALRRYAAAAVDIEAALGQDAQGTELRPALAWSLVQADQLDEAEPALRSALVEAPDHPLTLHARGVVQLRNGDPQEAIRLLRRARETGGAASPELLVDLGEALLEAGQLAEARELLEQALQRTGPGQGVHAKATRLLERLGG